MKWVFGNPAPGDMIRVKSGTIYHYGVYVSDDEVIQFGLAPRQRAVLRDSEVEVLASDIDTFLGGGFLEVCEFDRKEKKTNRGREEAIRFARERLGMKGYNILYNNCEHFARECVTGVRGCSQADDVRAMFRSMPVVDVYIARIPENGGVGAVYPPERAEDIARVSNERVRREKYYVWKLLAHALMHTFGFRMEKMNFTHHADGRWSAKECYFSLSHSTSAVAVAVSRAPVGVDIEAPRKMRYDQMAEHILSEAERADYALLPPEERADKLLAAWTAKEATFKSRHLSVFEPANIAIDASRLKTDGVMLDGERYIYSVASDTPDRIRLFTDVNLCDEA